MIAYTVLVGDSFVGGCYIVKSLGLRQIRIMSDNGRDQPYTRQWDSDRHSSLYPKSKPKPKRFTLFSGNKFEMQKIASLLLEERRKSTNM